MESWHATICRSVGACILDEFHGGLATLHLDIAQFTPWARGRNNLTDALVAESLRDSEFGVSERRPYGKVGFPARLAGRGFNRPERSSGLFFILQSGVGFGSLGGVYIGIRLRC